MLHVTNSILATSYCVLPPPCTPVLGYTTDRIYNRMYYRQDSLYHYEKILCSSCRICRIRALKCTLRQCKILEEHLVFIQQLSSALVGHIQGRWFRGRQFTYHCNHGGLTRSSRTLARFPVIQERRTAVIVGMCLDFPFVLGPLAMTVFVVDVVLVFLGECPESHLAGLPFEISSAGTTNFVETASFP